MPTGKKMDTFEFLEVCKEKRNDFDDFDFSEVIYITTKQKVKITRKKCGHTFEMRPNNFLNGQNCPECNKITTEEWVEKAQKIQGNKYDYSKVNYINAKTIICIICPIHGEFPQRPDVHINGSGCKLCFDEKQSHNTEIFIKMGQNVHGVDEFNYSEVVYKNNRTKVWITHNKCGTRFRQAPDKHLCGNYCPYCNYSKIEKHVIDILTKHNILFETQMGFKWLKHKKKLKLDFYLPKYNIAIECQGIQHFQETNFFEKLELIQERDRLKKQLCEEHNIPMYYINYNDDIEKRLNEIFEVLKKIK